MLFASGVNFGFRRTVPHGAGIIVGFTLLIVAIGFGLGFLLEQFPSLIYAIKFFGGFYMLYLAWRIANSGQLEVGESSARPMSFLEAALFQWANPKAYIMGITAISIYTVTENHSLNVAIVAAAFCFVSFPSIALWAGFGTVMRNYLQDPVKLKIFNYVLAGALVLSLVPMLTV